MTSWNGIPDEAVYGLLLVFSIVAGLPVRKFVTSSALRKLILGGLGFVVVLLVCGVVDFSYSFICFVINTIIIKLRLKHLSLLSFLWCFTYLYIFRSTHLFGLPKPSSLANAIQLVITLKLISVAADIDNFRHQSSSLVNDDHENEDISKQKRRFVLPLCFEPSITDLLCYSYSYPALFTGPFFTFRTFYDFVHLPKDTVLPFSGPFLRRIIQMPVFLCLYLFINKYYNVTSIKNDTSFYESSFLYRIFYISMVFQCGRFRFYAAWLAAECSCITLGIGAYPDKVQPRPGNGPTSDLLNENISDDDCQMNFDTISNIDCWKVEFAVTIRESMRNWNRSVQWWLVNYVHRRVHIKSIRNTVVLLVSAYWHGLHPGYFGAFCTMSVAITCEDIVRNAVVNKLNDKPTYLTIFNGCWWFMKMRAIDFMYISFVLLEWNHVYRCWKSLYFWPLVTAAFILLVSPFLVDKKPKLTPANGTVNSAEKAIVKKGQ